MPFPVAKLGYLAIKQIAKPLTNVIKHQATQSPWFRKTLLAAPAQWYHRVETTIRMKVLGIGRAKKVKQLDEEQAVQLGADMLGEIIIFTVGTAVIAAEYMRQVRKDASKEDKQNDRLSIVEGKVQELGLTIEQQSAEIRALNRTITSLQGSASEKPLPKKIHDPQSGITVAVEIKEPETKGS